jgi:hypothetical protein
MDRRQRIANLLLAVAVVVPTIGSPPVTGTIVTQVGCEGSQPTLGAALVTCRVQRFAKRNPPLDQRQFSP